MKKHIYSIFLFFTFLCSNIYSNQTHAAAMGFSSQVIGLGDSLAGPGASDEAKIQMYSFLEGAEGDKENLVYVVNTYVGPVASLFDKADALRTFALEPSARRATLATQANDLLPAGLDAHTKVQFLNALKRIRYSRREKMINAGRRLFHDGITLPERFMLFRAMKVMPEDQIPLRLANTLERIQDRGPDFFADAGLLLSLMQIRVFTDEELGIASAASAVPIPRPVMAPSASEAAPIPRPAILPSAASAAPIPRPVVVPSAAITGQEAVIGRGGENKRKIIEAYREIASKPGIREMLPEEDMVDASFAKIVPELKRKFELISIMNWGKSKRGSILGAAERGLEVLEGKRAGHRISSAAAYKGSEFRDASDIPSIWALFVLAYRLYETVEPREYVTAWLAEDPIRWTVAKRIFAEKFPKVMGHKTLGEALVQDEAGGGKFIKLLADLVDATGDEDAMRINITQARFAKRIAKDYRNKVFEDLMPLIDMLFMLVRGHNTKLEDMTEGDRPACAEGAQLNLLRIIAENSKVGGDAARLLSGVTVERCTAL